MILKMAVIMDNIAHHLEPTCNHLTDAMLGYVDSSCVFGLSSDEGLKRIVQIRGLKDMLKL